MKVRQRLWWVPGGVFLLFCVGFVLAAYYFGWSSTGFLSKSLWDWLQLLIVPLVLALIALVFQLANSRTERQLAKQRYEQDQHIVLDKQREDLLQAYLDRMSELLLKEKLRSSEVNAEVRNVARVRTITILFQLDARRIGYVFAFLRETGLMSNKPNSSIVSLKAADLRNINLSGANLGGADLSGANLNGANLKRAYLSGANLNRAKLGIADLNGGYFSGGANLSGAVLSEADFTRLVDDAYMEGLHSGGDLMRADLGGADLMRADLGGAYLIGADLSRADLSRAILNKAILSRADLNKANLSLADLSGAYLDGANLSGAYLDEANLSGADLTYANLSGADLRRANLRRADLVGAKLDGADFSGADLRGVRIIIEKLEKEAKSLQGTTMQDGSKHP